MDQLLYIVMGWLLGLLAPAIVDRIRRGYRNRDLVSAILSDLHEMQYKFALSWFMLRRRQGALTAQELAWLESIVRAYHGPEPNEALLEGVAGLNSLSDAQRRDFWNKPVDENRGLSIKELNSPLLAAHTVDMATLPLSCQMSFLRVRAKLDLYNQQVKFSQELFLRTFAVNGANNEILRANIREGYATLAVSAKGIVDAIAEIPIPKHYHWR